MRLVAREATYCVFGLAAGLLACGDQPVDWGDDAGMSPLAVDGGRPDGGAPSTGPGDSGVPGGGIHDAGALDAGVADGGAHDGGAHDGGSHDAGVADGGAHDGGAHDAGVLDGGAHDGGHPALCAGRPGSQRGKVLASVVVDAVKRTFVYYAPESLDPNTAVPLIISPHGFTMSGEDMYVLTGFRELADREGVVVVFPDGNAIDPWNVGSGVSGVGALVANPLSNDQGFIDALIAYADADQCIDAKHIFISGFSMGGYFSNENGCLRSDIAGIGPHSGGSHDLSGCPGAISPVILFHGDADPLITYNENGVLARDRWVARNGCATAVDTRSVEGGTCDYNRGCPPHAQVALCHFNGMGHLWAGGHGALNADPNRENAAELAWAFWREFAW